MGDVCIVLGPLSYHLSWVLLSSAQIFEDAQVNGKDWDLLDDQPLVTNAAAHWYSISNKKIL